MTRLAPQLRRAKRAALLKAQIKEYREVRALVEEAIASARLRRRRAWVRAGASALLVGLVCAFAILGVSWIVL